jgi:hypothetical protein
MLHDLVPFLKAVFKSWWLRIGVFNGLVGYSSRIWNFGKAAPVVSVSFVCIGFVFLGVAVLSVYHQQCEEIKSLNKKLADREGIKAILIQKLRGEVLYNIDHVNDPVTLQDDAYRTITPEHLRDIASDLRDEISTFYRELRSFKNTWQEFNPTPLAVARRNEMRKALAEKGNKLASLLMVDAK